MWLMFSGIGLLNVSNKIMTPHDSHSSALAQKLQAFLKSTVFAGQRDD